MPIKQVFSIGLLIFIPISIAAELQHWGDLVVCITSALAITPLAIWLSTATEKVAVVAGPSVGGLLNALFGNATALIIALVALNKGLVDIVKASITGSILSDLLLIMGLAMFLGGLRYKEQRFQPIVARVNGSSMTLAVVAIVLPTTVINTSNWVDQDIIDHFSVIVAVVLIVVYGLTLLFSLKTHSYLYDVGLADSDSEEIALIADTSVAEVMTRPQLWFWILVLLISTISIAVESELFVEVIDEATSGLGLTPLFTGVILLPLVGDIAGSITAIRMAMKNDMDLTVSIVMGSSLLVALFVAPLLVLVGQFIGQPMDLNFNTFEVISVAIAVTVVNFINLAGRSNWLEGTLLLATYIILGVAFYYHPPT